MIVIRDLESVARAIRSGLVRLTMEEWGDLDDEAQEILAQVGDRVAEAREAAHHRIRTEGYHEVVRDRADGGAGKRTRYLRAISAKAVERLNGKSA